MGRKVKKCLKASPVRVGRRRWTFLPSLFPYVEVGDEKESEKMAKKLSQCWQVSEDGLSCLLSFPTWRWEMRRKVKKGLKSYPSAGRLVKIDFLTFCLFLH